MCIPVRRALGSRNVLLILVSVIVSTGSAAPAQTSTAGAQGQGVSQNNMRLVGFNNLQARSAYQPIVQDQHGRFIAYIGHHGGSKLNPMSGAVEPNGTSILDVTDVRHPVYLKHLPGEGGAGEQGGAQMVRVCDGSVLPSGTPGRFYLLRTFGNSAHEVWDVTTPEKPTKLATIKSHANPGSNLGGTHKNWWDCKNGHAYLVSGELGWMTNRMMQVYDLSDPLNPRFIRDFGLPGQQPPNLVRAPEQLHGPIVVGDRVYMGYGTGSNGVLQILDRTVLLNDRALEDPMRDRRTRPEDADLLRPQIARYDVGPIQGAHTVFPVLGVKVPQFQRFTVGQTRDVVVLVNESLANECREATQLMYVVDITTETEPHGVASFQVDERTGDFCQRGGRFGTHSSNESMTPIYYGRIVFLTYFNAGVRAVDIRDPWSPKEIAHYIPATTADTDVRCVGEVCKVAIQTNNVDVDDRGYIYIVDRANTGMHVLELTGPARDIANFPR